MFHRLVMVSLLCVGPFVSQAAGDETPPGPSQRTAQVQKRYEHLRNRATGQVQILSAKLEQMKATSKVTESLAKEAGLHNSSILSVLERATAVDTLMAEQSKSLLELNDHFGGVDLRLAALSTTIGNIDVLFGESTELLGGATTSNEDSATALEERKKEQEEEKNKGKK